jgi:hypothetical protein
MSKQASFTYNALSGTLFPGSKFWAGSWSETGGAATHDIAFGEKDGVHSVAFRKVGGKGWTYCPITFAAEGDALRERSHKGYVTFKGNKLHLWYNFAKEHDGDHEYGRYDLKPSTRVAAPF